MLRRAMALLALTGLSGCPDTTNPPLSPRSATRVCTADEVSDFRNESQAFERTDLWVAFIDVGQGDATWIRTPGTVGVDAKDILIDAGDCRIDKPYAPLGGRVSECGIGVNPTAPGQVDGVGALIDFLSTNGWTAGNRFDYLVLTHPDKDHYGGAWRIVQEYIVDAVIDPGVETDAVTYQALRRAIESEGSQDLRPALETGIDLRASGDRRTRLWGFDTVVTLLAANADADRDNNASVVLKVEYRGVKLLLTGDSEAELDLQLVAEHGSNLQANVLKAGHHGGVGTNTDPLLDVIFPPATNSVRQFAVISSGRRDNLPADETVERLIERVGTFGLYRTDRKDAGKDRDTAPGDDHVLMRVTAEGELSVCYVFPDTQ
ncbi:MAG: competence protein ComEC [Bradymonadia bacterium]|jgi:competence protein ComEC